jgi:hypothetical protein
MPARRHLRTSRCLPRRAVVRHSWRLRRGAASRCATARSSSTLASAGGGGGGAPGGAPRALGGGGGGGGGRAAPSCEPLAMTPPPTPRNTLAAPLCGGARSPRQLHGALPHTHLSSPPPRPPPLTPRRCCCRRRAPGLVSLVRCGGVCVVAAGVARWVPRVGDAVPPRVHAGRDGSPHLAHEPHPGATRAPGRRPRVPGGPHALLRGAAVHHALPAAAGCARVMCGSGGRGGGGRRRALSHITAGGAMYTARSALTTPPPPPPPPHPTPPPPPRPPPPPHHHHFALPNPACPNADSNP